MNKVFSKIAGLSVGLALAIGVGVAVGGREAKAARAASGEIEIDYTTVADRVAGYSDSEMSYAHSITVGGVTYTANIKALKNDGTKVTNYYPGTSGKSYTQTRFYSKNSLAITVKDGKSNSMYITSVVFTSTTENYRNAMVNGTWTGGTIAASGGADPKWYSTITPNANTTELVGVLGGTTNLVKAVVSWTSEASYTPEISAPANASVGVGMTKDVTISYANLTSAITVTPASAAVSAPSSLNVSGSGEVTLTLTGVSAVNSVSVSLTSGDASTTIDVKVIAPTTYHLVKELMYLTPGTQFTVASKVESNYFYPTTFGDKYYNDGVTTATTSGDDVYFSAIDAATLTLEEDEEGILVKEGNLYVGSTNTTSASLTRNANKAQVTNRYWDVKEIDENNIATIVLTAAESGNITLRYNAGANRFSNYNNTSNISIFASYLAPYLFIEESNVEILDTGDYKINVNAVNFGSEEISFTVASSDPNVASGSVSEGKLTISPVAAGTTTLTVTASSTSFEATATVAVKVNSASRVLDHLTLSIDSDSLYKGQEFSYSGTVTAVYDNSDEVLLDNSAVTFTGYDMTTIGDQTVTVSYTDGVTKSASYTLTVSQWTGKLKIGNYYVLASIFTDKEVDYQFAMVDVGKINTANVGIAASYGDTLRSESAMLVVAGSTYNSYAFKLSNGKYISAGNSNSLFTSEEVESASSWTVTASGDNFVITNVGFERSIKYNASSPRFAAYGSGQKDVTLIPVSYTDVASHFMTNFMHPEIDFDDKGSGECKGEEGYYAKAKAAFNVMPEESRNFFMISTMYTNYKARLAAWAAANGDEFSETNLLVTNPSSRVVFDTVGDDNTMIIVISIAATSALAFTMLLVFKKKRQK